MILQQTIIILAHQVPPGGLKIIFAPIFFQINLFNIRMKRHVHSLPLGVICMMGAFIIDELKRWPMRTVQVMDGGRLAALEPNRQMASCP